jgi:membrane-associated protein
MDFLQQTIDLFLHLDTHLSAVITTYGTWTYLILFVIILCETGLVTPFLPGDSLLFAAGTFAATGVLDIWGLTGLLIIAAILGDTMNYAVGYYVGPRIFRKDTGWLLNKVHLNRTEKFYEKHGPKTIIIARFLPIIRTFAPFVAGIGRMSYPKFLAYNIIGGVVWVVLFLFAGYGFGNIPVVKENFEFVILGIIFVSFVPGVWHIVKERMSRQKISGQRTMDNGQ